MLDYIYYSWGDHITGFTSLLRSLRCFGHLITDLITITYQTERFLNELYLYVNKYCSKNLIQWESGLACPINNFFKPFLKLKQLTFANYPLENELMNLHKWFPKLKSLVLDHCLFRGVETHIPHLYEFKCDYSMNSIEMEIFEKFFRINNQLRKVDISILDVKLYQYMSEYLNQLNYLRIKVKTFHDNFEQIHFKNVQKFVVSYGHLLPINLFTFDRLKVFSINCLKFNGLDEFLKRHSTIKRLEITTCSWEHENVAEKILEMAKTLPLLDCLSCLEMDISVNDAYRFMVELEKLKTFKIEKKNSFDVGDLVKRLENKWQLTENECLIVFERSF